MAIPTTFTGNTPRYLEEILSQRILIEVDFGNTGEFTLATMINGTRSMNYQTTNEAEEIVDLANIDDAAAMVRHIRATDTRVTGEGMVHGPDLFKWVQWSKKGKSYNCRITVGDSYTEEGTFVLSDFSYSGDRQSGIKASITLEQSAPTVTTETATSNSTSNASTTPGQ